MTTLWCDFETRSRCDLKTAGVYNYAQDASTQGLCLSYAFDDEDVQTWTPGQPFPLRVAQHTGQIRAHNAAFERLIFWYVLQINFTLEQFYCTATQARANCAPGSLEDVGRFASASMKKDHRGAHLIRKLCIPPFSEDVDLMAELIAYCEQDVRAMRAISSAMRDLSADELADYHVNERINDRGVKVDVALCSAAIKYASAEVEEIQEIVSEVTKGEITSVRSPKMRQWVQDRVGPEALKLMTVYKDDVPKMSIDKSVRANLLAMDNADEVPVDVQEVIQCADDLWASSVAKFNRLAQLADEEDDRVRGAFVFAGGSATGRASSYGAQVHNFTRKCAKEPQAARDAMVRGHSIVPQFGKRVTDVLKGMLRPAIIPEKGKVLIVADWAAIEARANPWLSAQPTAEAVLDVFREGRDIYIREAAGIFHCTEEQVTSDRRQLGKVAILSCFGRDTQVLTNTGYKAIVDVSKADLLWDGVEWVKHQGLIPKGTQKVISAFGMSVTEGHLIKVRQGWSEAKTVLSNLSILTQALEVGSVNLPSYEPTTKKRGLARSVWLRCSVPAALRRTAFTSIICLRVRLHVAMCALKKRLDTGEKIILSTPKYAPMMRTDAGFLTDYRLAKIDAITQRTADTLTMESGEFTFTLYGARIKPLSLNTSSPWTDGTRRHLNLIALTLIKATNRATYALLPVLKTWLTGEKFWRCNNTSKNLRPVYDILNSGPRNRFTIKTDVGHLLVHNCGYGGGIGAFAAMGRNYGVVLPESDARRTVDAWRRANPWAVRYWQQLEEAYTRAMRNKGHEFKAGRVTYLFDGVHLWYALPSGRILCYPYAKLDNDGVTYAKAAWKPAVDAKEWPRARLWKGLACENITQAAANDILRHSLRQLDNIVLHVHDEIVVECPASDADAVKIEMERVMCTPPAWAAGLPLAVEIKTHQRYGK